MPRPCDFNLFFGDFKEPGLFFLPRSEDFDSCRVGIMGADSLKDSNTCSLSDHVFTLELLLPGLPGSPILRLLKDWHR